MLGTSATAGGTITNANGKCLDVYHSGTTAGTLVDLFKCNGSSAQNWHVSGTTITNPHSNLCLTDTASTTTKGTQVTLAKCTGAKSQAWTASSQSTGTTGGKGGGSSTTSGGGRTSSTGCAPAASATMTNTVSHKCGFPDTTNTGTTGTLYAVGSGPASNTGKGWLVSGGIISVSANGVLENVNTGGKMVEIHGANATIKNNKIVSSSAQGAFGITMYSANNALIENNEIGGTSGSDNMEAGIKDSESGSTYSANVDIKANNIYYVSTGIQVDHGTVESNYIHNLSTINGEHVNGTTSNGGGDGASLAIDHNTVFNPVSQTDAISLFEDFAVQQNRTINDNLVAGGGYCIYGGQNSGGATVKNIHITNNHFSKMYYSQCGSYGYIAAEPNIGSNSNTWSGNVWDETGATVNP